MGYFSMKRIVGLDSLRAMAALWVMIGHGAVPPITAGHDESSFFPWALNGIYGGSFSGPAAVIVFFVISGFCVHYPYSCHKKFNLGEFFVRRYLRILLPMAAAILIIRAVGYIPWDSPRLLSGIPGWSLVAELIYYSLYPLLVIIGQRVKWINLFYITFIIGIFFAFTVPINNINYPAWGYRGDWILGLPCWLLGILLAESLKNPLPNPTSSSIWTWRIGAIILGSITRNLAFQRIIGNHLTLNFFAIYVFFWLLREVSYYNKQENKPLAFLEWAGLWSYSLFLIHPLAFYLFKSMQLPSFGYMVDWFLKFNFVLLLSIAFYFAVEKPSHLLSRRIGKMLTIKPSQS
ncbi:acyltransferase [Microcystis aeruginosa 1339]|uniref:acyltransferase family protein n=2 Tax=Microcystis TaxID=1125 RepID=UPI00313434DA